MTESEIGLLAEAFDLGLDEVRACLERLKIADDLLADAPGRSSVE